MKDSLHKTYSGYPGGLYEKSWKDVSAKKGFGELIIHAVSGMIPRNKLHDKRLMNLSTEE
jgi:large subunit ribosomal protein L13